MPFSIPYLHHQGNLRWNVAVLEAPSCFTAWSRRLVLGLRFVAVLGQNAFFAYVNAPLRSLTMMMMLGQPAAGFQISQQVQNLLL
jgi:hypothetical protein